MAERRRLPVLQPSKPAASPEDVEPPRPPWHWVGFGTVAIFAVWLPLVLVATHLVRGALVSRFGEGASRDQIDLAIAAMSASERARVVITQAFPHAAALALAAFAGGLLVGRFGAGTGSREAALSGAATALLAAALTLRTGGVAWTTAIVFAIAVAFAAWGGRVGARRRDRASGGVPS